MLGTTQNLLFISLQREKTEKLYIFLCFFIKKTFQHLFLGFIFAFVRNKKYLCSHFF